MPYQDLPSAAQQIDTQFGPGTSNLVFQHLDQGGGLTGQEVGEFLINPFTYATGKGYSFGGEDGSTFDPFGNIIIPGPGAGGPAVPVGNVPGYTVDTDLGSGSTDGTPGGGLPGGGLPGGPPGGVTLPPPGSGGVADHPFFGAFQSAFGQSAADFPIFDFDRSGGNIDFADFISLADRFKTGQSLFALPEQVQQQGPDGNQDVFQKFDLSDYFTGQFPQFDLSSLFTGTPNAPQIDLSSLFTGTPNAPQFDLSSLFTGQFPQIDLSSLFTGVPNISPIDIGFNPQQLSYEDIFNFGPGGNVPIGFDTSGLDIPNIGIDPDALAGLTGFRDALQDFGAFDIDKAVRLKLDPLITNVQDLIDSLNAQAGIVLDPEGFATPKTDEEGEPILSDVEEFTNLEFPGITDDRQFVTDLLLNQITGASGAQDLVGQELVDALGAGNPFARLTEGDDSVLDQVLGLISRQAEKGRDRLLNQFAVTNKLDLPIFKEELQGFEGNVLDAEANAFINFGLQEAGASEGIRRGRIDDLSRFNRGVTGDLSGALAQLTSNFVTDIGLQNTQQGIALQDFLNTLAFNNAVGSAQAGFTDQGLGLGLNFLGLGSGSNAGLQAAGIFGNIANQQQRAGAADQTNLNSLAALLTNPALFRSGD